MITLSYGRRLHHHETDSHGVCHASNYLRLFEEALTEALCTVGQPPEQLPYNVAIAETQIFYKQPLRYGDYFECLLSFTAVRRARIFLTATISRDSSVCTTIVCILAAIDPASRKSISFHEALRRKLQKHVNPDNHL